MSQVQSEEIKEQAAEIYGIFVESVGHKFHDWRPLAVKAFEASEAFSGVFEDRYGAPK